MVSFIIPLFNHLDDTQAMLASLLETLPPALHYEILLIDDDSTDGTRAWLQTLSEPNCHILLNEHNLGYAKTNNKAIAQAKGEVLVLLNSDLLLLSGWLEPMLAVLQNPALNVGIVGNLQYTVDDNVLDHAGVEVTACAKLAHRQALPTDSATYYSAFAVTGACCLLFREDFLAVGGFDEVFVNGGEDIDLCLKLRALGKNVYVARNSVVKHHVSLSRDRTALSNEYNSYYLFSRWRKPIFEAIRQAWLSILQEQQASSLTQAFALKPGLLQTPVLTAGLLANYWLSLEEVRWQSLFAPSIANHNVALLSYSGFCWNQAHPCAFISGIGFINCVPSYTAANLFISGVVLPHAVGFQQLQVCVEVNGVQQRSWSIENSGHFNWQFPQPLLRPSQSSFITLSLHFSSASVYEVLPVPLHIAQCVRFSKILLDDQIILELR